MRLVLALILLGQACHLKGNPTTTTTIEEQTRTYYQKCARDCNASKDLLVRAPEMIFKNTEEDKCYLVCVNRFFKTIGEDGKFNTTVVESAFLSQGLSKPQDLHLISELPETDNDFTVRTVSFAAKNRQLLLDFHRIVTATAPQPVDNNVLT